MASSVVNGIHSIRFNDSRTNFTMATENGVKLIGMEPLCLLGEMKKYHVGSCVLAEPYFDSFVVAVVGGGKMPMYSETCVMIVNVGIKMLCWKINTKNNVLAIRFTRDRMITAHLEKVYVFDMHDDIGEMLHEIKTGFNHKGLLEVSRNGVVVFPAQMKGHVEVVELSQLKKGTTVSPIIISAHQGEIARMAISNNGNMVATVSDKGTLMRVYDVATKKQEQELRRGCDSAIIYSISFSPCDEFISVCSDKGTLHVFSLKDTSLNKTTVFSQVGTLLPSNLGKAIEEQKSMAQGSIPEECPSVLAFLDRTNIAAVCVDGTLQKFQVIGGQCKLRLSTYTLDIGADFDFY